MNFRASWMTVLGAALLAGCADNESLVSSADLLPSPIGVQLQKTSPELTGHRFNDVLGFESASDSVFLNPDHLTMTPDHARAHTGRLSMRLNSSADPGALSIKLSAAIGAIPFPNKWTIVGAYFYSEKPVQIAASCQLDGLPFSQNVVNLAAKQWTPVMIDLANPTEAGAPSAGAPTLKFELNTSGEVWCDDVVMIDNTQWIVSNEQSARSNDWNISRRGLKIVCSTPDQFALRLTPADLNPDGWRLEEANAFRARFSSNGPSKMTTVYPDGRTYVDGQYRPLSTETRALPFWQQQHQSPGQIEVPESLGRPNRVSLGDANNDGYNESRATYMIIATGPRLALTLTPGAVPIYRPLLEITGLPLGDALVTVEGKLIKKMLRLDDGTLLVELPGRLDRPTSVNIRIQ